MTCGDKQWLTVTNSSEFDVPVPGIPGIGNFSFFWWYRKNLVPEKSFFFYWPIDSRQSMATTHKLLTCHITRNTTFNFQAYGSSFHLAAHISNTHIKLGLKRKNWCSSGIIMSSFQRTSCTCGVAQAPPALPFEGVLASQVLQWPANWATCLVRGGG